MPAFLLTRPAPSAARFAAALKGRLGDVSCVISPLLRIDFRSVPLPQGLPIFTSRNGIEGFLRAGGAAQGPCWCVGDATAQAARQAGFDPRSARGDADALVAAIRASDVTGPFLHPRGAHTSGDIAGRLRAAGLPVAEAVVYDQIAQDLNSEARALLQSENPIILPLFSPRSAAQFAKVHRGRAPLFVAAMSAGVLDALDGCRPRQAMIAARPDGDAMLDAVGGLFDAALQLEGGRGAK